MAEKNTADIGFEKQIWNAACVLRGNMDASEYKGCLLYTSAHVLMDRFGDFAGVLDASEEDLLTVEGVGPSTARMLHLLPQIGRYYTQCAVNGKKCMKTTDQLAEYLMAQFAGTVQERALLAALDGRSRIKGLFWLRDGTSDRVSLEIKDVVAAALKGGTDSVVLCHNHPNGVALPSREDQIGRAHV